MTHWELEDLKRRLKVLEDKFDRLELHQHTTLVEGTYYPSGGAFTGDQMKTTPVKIDPLAVTNVDENDKLYQSVRQELLRHVSGWIDNGEPPSSTVDAIKAHCECGHKGIPGEWHSDHVAAAVIRAMQGLKK